MRDEVEVVSVRRVQEGKERLSSCGRCWVAMLQLCGSCAEAGW